MTDHREAVQVVRAHPGQPVIITFASAGAAAVESRWEDRIARNLHRDLGWIRLEDQTRGGFYDGVVGLGDTIEAAVGSLRLLIDELAPGRVLTCGSGVAGHAALVYGVLLGASRIVAVEPLAHRVAESLAQYHDRRTYPELAHEPDPALARRCDVFPLMGRSGFKGEAHILLGSRRTNDHPDAVHLNAIHAEWLARSPRVTIHRFDQLAPGLTPTGDAHDPVAALLARLVAEDGPQPAAIADQGRSPDPHPRLVYDAKLTICRVAADHPANRTGDLVEFAAAGQVDVTTTRKMTAELRRWIVENLLLDAAPDDLATNLLPLGLSRRETLREVDLARFHPYFLATQRVLNRLAKRDWLLTTYRKLDRLRRRPYQIERPGHLSGTEFLQRYASAGRPVLLTGAIADPAALDPWAFAGLVDRLGQTEVDLTVPGGGTERSTLARYLLGIEPQTPDDGHPRTLEADGTAANTNFWTKISPNLEALTANLPLAERDQGVCWFGPRGASPPATDEAVPILIAQVVGRVRAEVLPPWDVELAKARARTDLVGVARPVSATSFPPLDQPELLEFSLNPGDLLFLPAGCQSRFEAAEAAARVVFPAIFREPDRVVDPAAEA